MASGRPPMATYGLQLPARRGPDPEFKQCVAPASLDTPLPGLGAEDADQHAAQHAQHRRRRALVEDLQATRLLLARHLLAAPG